MSPPKSEKSKPWYKRADAWLSQSWVKACVIAASVAVWGFLLVVNWNGWSFCLLFCAIAPILLVPFIWGAGSNLLSRMLLLLAVTGVVLSAFLIRIWLSVNLAWRVGEDGRAEKPLTHGLAIVHPDVLRMDAEEPIELRSLAFGSLQTPITLTFTVVPTELVRIEPALVVIRPDLDGGGRLLTTASGEEESAADGTPEDWNGRVSEEIEATAVADRLAVAVLSHNHRWAEECEEALPQARIPWQQLLFWLELMLGDRCHWADATVTLEVLAPPTSSQPAGIPTIPATAGAPAGSPGAFVTRVETISRASLREFASNSASTGSPLLILIPSTVALAAYVFARQQDQAERKRKKDQEDADQQFEQFKKSLIDLDLANAVQKQAELERYVRSGCISEQRFEASRDLISIGSEWVLPDANRIQTLLGDYAELTIAAATLRSTDNPSGGHRDMMKMIVANPRFAALKRTYPELCDGFLQAQKRVEQVSQCEHQEWPRTDVTQYAESQSQVLQTYLGDLDPFLIVSAEFEHFSVWCELDAFWQEHPVYNLVRGAKGKWVVYGEVGSGKTAIALADRARMVKNRASLDGLWVRAAGHADLRTIQSRIAQDLLDFIVEYPCYWRNLRVAQQEWLTQFWLATLGRETVLMKTAFIQRLSDEAQRDAERRALESTVRSIERSFVRAPSPQAWIDSIFSIAHAVGFDQVRLFVDEISRPPTDREAEQLMRLAEAHIDVFVLTKQPEVTADLERHGFRTVPLAWTPAQLWQMAFYRLSAFNRQAEVSHPAPISRIGQLLNPNRPLHEWRDELPIQAVFTREGWAAAIALSKIRTPRDMFRFWHALLQLPAATGQIEKIDAAGVHSAWETVRSHDT